MSKLIECANCNGFLRVDATTCPHCEASREPASSLSKLGFGLLGCVGGGAMAITMMACYGACPPEGCSYSDPLDQGPFPPPKITSIVPPYGINNQPGTRIEIDGTGFLEGATVTVGGAACTNVLVDSTAITCSVPPRAATCGPQTVVVTNPDNQQATSTGFSYLTSMLAFTAAPGSPLPTGATPHRVLVGDWNKDGKADLVTAEQGTSKLEFFQGNGNGTFKVPISLNLVGTTGESEIVGGDFDKDGNPDLIVTNAGSANVGVYLGNGDGTFKPGKSYGGGLTNNQAIAMGDLNKDGYLDVVVGSNSAGVNGLATFLNQGAGAPGVFSNGAAVVGPDNHPGLAITDWDGDGNPDVLATGQMSHRLYVYKGKGDGTFTLPPTPQALVGCLTPIGIHLTDLNDDGKADVAIACNSSKTVPILFNGSNIVVWMFSTGDAPQSLWAADMNGDGQLDLVTANSQNSWSYLPGAINGLFTTPALVTAFGSVGQVVGGIAVADFNGDKQPDVAITQQTANTLGVFLQQCK